MLTGKRRVVLGVRFGPPVLIAWFSVTGFIAVVLLRYFRTGLTHIPGSAVGPLVVSIAAALLFRAKHIVGSSIEIDDSQICLRAYGYLWFPRRVPLSAVLSAAPMGEDEPTSDGQYGERAPRLLISLLDQRYEIFGPWTTRNADDDYQQIRALFGPLFIGDGKLRR
jgi:hypothetical protein